MGNIVYSKESAQPVIWVDENGYSVFDPTVKVCEPEDAQPIIYVNTSGNQA